MEQIGLVSSSHNLLIHNNWEDRQIMMNVDSLPTVRTRDNHVRIRRKKLGIGTVISSVIMVAAVAMLGSVVLIWANSSLNVEKTRIANDYANNTNSLRESFIVEDVWLDGPPVPENRVNITIRNIGDIAIKVKQFNVTAVNATGAIACASGCTNTTNPSNIVLESKTSYTILVKNIDWDHTLAKSLDITITTERNSVEKIFWRVRQ